jgi:hypothetical protein
VHRISFAGLIFLLSVAGVARAQSASGVAEGSVDVGGAVLRQPGLADAGVVTAGGQFRYATAVSDVIMNGIGARTPEDRYTGQGMVSASRYGAPGQSWRWEVTGSASAFGVSNAGPAFGWQALAREHYGSALGGAFAGIGFGEVTQAGIWNRLVTGHLGGFIRPDPLGRDELSAAVALTSVGTVASNGGNFGYVDGIAYWSHRGNRIELGAGGGLRARSTASLTTSPWGSASAALWVSSYTAVVIAGGRALEDVTRGVPSVRYLSVSVRFGTRGSDARLAALVRRAAAADEPGRIDVRASSDSLRVVSVRLRNAAGVEIMADFTDWQPVALTSMPNGTWGIERAIAPGTHRVAIRVDGGVWTVPPNLPRVTDDFGGEVGLLIVP